MQDNAFSTLTTEQLDQIDATCDQFKARLISDESARIEDYLATNDDKLRVALFRELLDTEIGMLRAGGRHVTVDQYESRFPEFAPIVEDVLATADEHAADATGLRHQDDTDRLPQAQGRMDARPADGDSNGLPREFGRYRLLRVLGCGGMGTVYLAHDSRLDRQVALKMPEFGQHKAAAQMMIDRFHREARAMATASHPNLCPIHDVGEHDGHPYLTMTCIAGRPLSEIIDNAQPLPAEEAVRIVRTLALALEAVHQAGVIHRDVKPANVMVDSQQQLFLTDFGLALRDRQLEAGLTNSSTVIGTPAYMAPEQVRAQHDRIGPATDVYALGVILYELLSGRRPFAGDGLGVLGEITSGNPPPRPSELSDIHEQLEAVCLKAMAHDVDDRFQTAAELVSALNRLSLDRSRGRPDQSQRSSGKLSASDGRTLERRRSALTSGLLLGFVSFAALISAAAMTVYRVNTPYGEVVVRAAEGVDVEIDVQDDGEVVAVLGPENNWQVRIEGGKYQLKLRGGGHELSLDKDTVEVSRDDRVEVTIARRENSALEFDGESTYVHIPTLARNDPGPATLECWVRPDQQLPDSGKIICVIGGSARLELAKFKDLFWSAEEHTPWWINDDNPKFAPGKWIHLAAVADDEELRLYVGGKCELRVPRELERTFYDNTPLPAKGAWIGAHPYPKTDSKEVGTFSYFRGQIDELRVSAGARYDEDFEPESRFEPDDQTLALYHFEEGKGKKLTDSSKHGHHGSIVGGRWVKFGDDYQVTDCATRWLAH